MLPRGRACAGGASLRQASPYQQSLSNQSARVSGSEHMLRGGSEPWMAPTGVSAAPVH